MPKFVKFLLVLGSIVVTAALLALVIHGHIAPKSRSVIKLSGFSDWSELGKYSFRQTYGQLAQIQYVVIGGGESDFWEDFLVGFQNESQLQMGSQWQVLNEIPSEFEEGVRYIIRLDFDQSFPFSSAYFGKTAAGRYASFSFSNLLHPSEFASLSEECDGEKKVSLVCLRERISMVSKRYWPKVQSCKKATLDQISKYDFLILLNTKDCESQSIEEKPTKEEHQ